MATPLSFQEKIQRGGDDAGAYFRHMAEFVGFTPEDAQAIAESRLIIEKYLPEIVAQFYTHLLRYPPTRKHFQRKDGSIDQDYVQLRMHHLTNFWRRTASGKYDDEYARYIDYVGRAHTNHGADPNIYIAERYVIGQVGFVQHAISQALAKELHEFDPDFETRTQKAWNLLMMVILEMLSRAYENEREVDISHPTAGVNTEAVFNLAVDAYERGLGLQRQVGAKDILVGMADEIPVGERKIIQVDQISIGVFHHKDGWYALRNSCLHRGGPVCTGRIQGDVITCPWHGYQYNMTDGKLIVDPGVKLETFPVELRGDEIYLRFPLMQKNEIDLSIKEEQPGDNMPHAKQNNEFRLSEIAPGQAKLVYLGKTAVAVYNVGGKFYATQDACTHAEGPLSEGELDGVHITCPLHGSVFDVTTGSVLDGPADQPLKTYQVIFSGDVGRVEEQSG